MRKIPMALALLAALAAAPVAHAHPHVFIDMRSAVSFNAAGHVDAIGISWTFDEFYSQFTTDGVDTNGNGKFDPAELQTLANSFAKNLKEFRHFTFIEIDGRLIDNSTPANARAIVKDGQLTFAFRLPLAKPVDPARTKIRFTSIDPSYYVDISPAASTPVSMVGAPKHCTHALARVDSTRPGGYNLSTSIRMTAPADDVLNSTNAAVVEVSCKG
jgi:ABC-type uncharacterized transport system substrate-binding protein